MEDFANVTNEPSKGIMDKTTNELTVGDQLKLSAALTAATVAVCTVGLAAIAGIGALVERRQAKKAQKKLVLVKDEETNTETN